MTLSTNDRVRELNALLNTLELKVKKWEATPSDVSLDEICVGEEEGWVEGNVNGLTYAINLLKRRINVLTRLEHVPERPQEP